jgi:hypothetical protein
LNDAACAPDLPDLAVIDAPFVFLVGCGNNVEALDERSETGCVGCFTEVFDEGRFVLDVDGIWWEAAV